MRSSFSFPFALLHSAFIFYRPSAPAAGELSWRKVSTAVAFFFRFNDKTVNRMLMRAYVSQRTVKFQELNALQASEHDYVTCSLKGLERLQKLRY